MAKQNISSGGGKWALPAATTGAPQKEKPKSGASRSVAGADKHSTSAPGDFSIAASLSAKNKQH